MKRVDFLKSLGILSLSATGMGDLNALSKWAKEWENYPVMMPALFIGHGAPMYTLNENEFSLKWRELGKSLPIPRAIVSISAHWLTPGKTKVTAAQSPKTIHDFGRMDDRLFEINYPAPGSPELAAEIRTGVKSVEVEEDLQWGLDHGTWCVLNWMYPKADIPVIQLSIDYGKGASYHFELGRQLQFLRRKGVLIIGSGNIVHNLRMIKFPEDEKYDWAIEFDQKAKELMDLGDFQSLIHYEKLGRAAQLSIPTPDHYFPLMYTLGLKTEKDELSHPIDGGISYGSTSMRSILISEG